MKIGLCSDTIFAENVYPFGGKKKQPWMEKEETLKYYQLLPIHQFCTFIHTKVDQLTIIFHIHCSYYIMYR